jgi:hypothetical protein
MPKEKLNRAGFSLKDFTFREFEIFLIILRYEGQELSILKHYIDLALREKRRKKEEEYKSRIKGYDYIYALEEKNIAKIKKEAGKKRVYIDKKVRDNYEKFISPTFKDKKRAYKEFLKENLDEISSSVKYRDRLIEFTNNILKEIHGIITKTPENGFNKLKMIKEIKKVVESVKREELLVVAYEIIPKKED